MSSIVEEEELEEKLVARDPSKKWAIVDLKNGRPYIPQLWTKAEAQRELEGLLSPYPEGHEWRLRLSVALWPNPIRGNANWKF